MKTDFGNPTITSCEYECLCVCVHTCIQSEKYDISNEREIMNYSVNHAEAINYLCKEITDSLPK